jgi:hypothetical protein
MLKASGLVEPNSSTWEYLAGTSGSRFPVMAYDPSKVVLRAADRKISRVAVSAATGTGNSRIITYNDGSRDTRTEGEHVRGEITIQAIL